MARFVRLIDAGSVDRGEVFVNIDLVTFMRRTTAGAGQTALHFSNEQTVSVREEPLLILKRSYSPPTPDLGL